MVCFAGQAAARCKAERSCLTPAQAVDATRTDPSAGPSAASNMISVQRYLPLDFFALPVRSLSGRRLSRFPAGQRLAQPRLQTYGEIWQTGYAPCRQFYGKARWRAVS